MPVLEAGAHIITHTHTHTHPLLLLPCPEPAVPGSGERQGWVLPGPRAGGRVLCRGLLQDTRQQSLLGEGQKVRLAEWGPPSDVPKSSGASAGCVTRAELSLLSGS